MHVWITLCHFLCGSETMVRQKCQSDDNQHDHHHQQQQQQQHNRQLLYQIERILWKQSKQNTTIYADMSTLQGRLQSLMMIVLSSRRRKRSQQQAKPQQQQLSTSVNHHVRSSPSSSTSSLSSTVRTTSNSRDRTLVQLMGTVRYDRAVTLVRSIRDCKLQYMAKHTKSCCNSSSSSSSRNNNNNKRKQRSNDNKIDYNVCDTSTVCSNRNGGREGRCR